MAQKWVVKERIHKNDLKLKFSVGSFGVNISHIYNTLAKTCVHFVLHKGLKTTSISACARMEMLSCPCTSTQQPILNPTPKSRNSCK